MFIYVYFQYGPVFSFTMVGQTFTYLVSSDASALLFNSKNDNLNAEDVYSRLTTPVFGKGVAYDVPHAVSTLIFTVHSFKSLILSYKKSSICKTSANLVIWCEDVNSNVSNMLL